MIIRNTLAVCGETIQNNIDIRIENDKITAIAINLIPKENEEIIDGTGLIAMPGFIDIHIHGVKNIDFMDAKEEDYETIANALYSEGVTTFLATTLTSDQESLLKVAKEVKKAKEHVPSLGGIHLEGPYIAINKKGAQNEAYIRKANIDELKELIDASGNNIRLISLAPEKEGALEFIKEATKLGVTCSAGHTEASFNDVENAIACGLTNTTHTHNAMSSHDHRKPGVVTAAFTFDELYTEFICDTIHVCKDSLKASYKIIGPDRFMIITDSLKVKHADVDEFELFGLPCVKRDGAAYLKSGPLAGSLLEFDKGLRNIKEITNASLVDLAKISSRNQAKSLNLTNRGEIKEGLLADIVLLNNDLTINSVYKLGKKVY